MKKIKRKYVLANYCQKKSFKSIDEIKEWAKNGDHFPNSGNAWKIKKEINTVEDVELPWDEPARDNEIIKEILHLAVEHTTPVFLLGDKLFYRVSNPKYWSIFPYEIGALEFAYRLGIPFDQLFKILRNRSVWDTIYTDKATKSMIDYDFFRMLNYHGDSSADMCKWIVLKKRYSTIDLRKAFKNGEYGIAETNPDAFKAYRNLNSELGSNRNTTVKYSREGIGVDLRKEYLDIISSYPIEKIDVFRIIGCGPDNGILLRFPPESDPRANNDKLFPYTIRAFAKIPNLLLIKNFKGTVVTYNEWLYHYDGAALERCNVDENLLKYIQDTLS